MREWNLETIPENTKSALRFLRTEKWLFRDGWYLAGGTALGLQVGHRQSVDLDFFTEKKTFSPVSVTNHFSKEAWKAEIVEEGTVYGAICGAKASFIAYPFFVPAVPKLSYGEVSVLHKDDIAVMKVIAISQRGRKRDFVDLYWYAKNVASLQSVIMKLPRQYPDVAHNFHHIIKSMIYFNDAENDLMPTLSFKATWKEIKDYFQREVPRVAKEIIGLD